MRGVSQIEEIERLIKRGATEEAIDALFDIARDTQSANELINLQRRIHTLKKEKALDLRSYSDLNKESNQIRERVLYLIRELSDEKKEKQSLLSSEIKRKRIFLVGLAVILILFLFSFLLEPNLQKISPAIWIQTSRGILGIGGFILAFSIISILLKEGKQENRNRSEWDSKDQSPFQLVKRLISQNQIKEAFEELNRIASGRDRDKLATLQNKYANLIHDERAMIINPEEANLRKNNILVSLLRFVDKLAQKAK